MPGATRLESIVQKVSLARAFRTKKARALEYLRITPEQWDFFKNIELPERSKKSRSEWHGEVIDKATEEGYETIRDFVELFGVKPPTAHSYFLMGQRTWPEEKEPYPYNPKIDRYVYTTLDTKEIAALVGMSEQNVRYYFTWSGTGAVHREYLRQHRPSKYTTRKEARANRFLGEQIFIGLMQEGEWEERKAAKYLSQIRVRDPDHWVDVIKVFAKYRAAFEAGEKARTTDLAQGTAFGQSQVSTMLLVTNTPLLKWQRFTDEEMQATNTCLGEGMWQEDIKYFLGKNFPHLTYHFAKHNVTSASKPKPFIGHVHGLKYNTISRILQAEQEGTAQDEDITEAMITYVQKHKEELARDITNKLRVLYRDPNHNTPLRKPKELPPI